MREERDVEVEVGRSEEEEEVGLSGERVQLEELGASAFV